MNYAELVQLQDTVVIIALLSLVYGSYTDLKTRTIKSYLFIPLMIAGIVQNYYFGAPTIFIVAALLVFFFAFLVPDTWAYLIIGMVFLGISSYYTLSTDFYWGFQLVIISVVYLIGFQETFFGNGDIKAIIACMFSMSIYWFDTGSLFKENIYYYNIPAGLAILVNIAVFSSVYLLYGHILASRYGHAKIPGQPYSINYDQAVLDLKPHAFQVFEYQGQKYLRYRVPFMIPILLGFVLFLAAGFWPALL
ncbi:MAG: prepilin peptidase [Candidatus Thermoplasmatota archaeon]|nr:prepilin peptidase [Candidatus Thermoplasmatota archaeon]